MHIPFLALRTGKRRPDGRHIGGKQLRESMKLPLDKHGNPPTDLTEEYYYEAVASASIIGIDEWVWTGYCCIDTYFGEEAWNYPDSPKDEETDGPSGGSILQKRPVWNPRQYFLVVLQQRVIQATTEWNALIMTFAERLKIYVSNRLLGDSDGKD
jgi:hypothetical protein